MKKILAFAIGIFLTGLAWGQCVPDFTVSTDTICPGEEICFRSLATANTVTSYSWNFGSGNSTLRNPCFSFPTNPAGGNVIVTLTVTDTAGVSCSSSQTITILPSTNLMGIISPQLQFCRIAPPANDTAVVTISILPNNPSLLPLVFDYGDGQVDTLNQFSVTHTYRCYGKFGVNVFVEGQNCPGYVDSIEFFRDIVTDLVLGDTSSFFCEGDTIIARNRTNVICNNVERFCWNFDLGTIPGPTYCVSDTSSQSFAYDLSGLDLCTVGSGDLSGFITLRGENSCGNQTSATEIFIIPTPRPEINFPDTLCEGVLPFFTTPYNTSCPKRSFLNGNLTYSWDFGNGQTSSAIDTIVDFSNEPPGRYIVSYTITNNCASRTVRDTIIIVQPPIADLDPDTTVTCAPNGCINFRNLTQPDTIPAIYTWTVDPPGSSRIVVDSATQNATICFDAAGKYLVTLNATNVCGTSFDTVSITVNLSPTIDFGVTIPDTCGTFTLNTLPFTITANGSNVRDTTWASSGLSPGPPPITFPPAQSHFVRLSVVNDCGTTSRAIGFFVDSLPPVSAMANDTICEDDGPLLLTAVPDSGYWIGPGVDSTNGQWFFTNPGTTGTYQLIYVLDGQFCFAYDTVDIEVIPAPTVTTRADTAYCFDPGVSVLLTATPAGGTWSALDTTVSLINDRFQADTSGVFEFVYEFQDLNTNCIGRDTMRIFVNPLPTAIIDDPRDTLLLCITAIPQDLPPTLPPVNPPGAVWSGSPNIVNNTQFLPTALDTLDLYFTVTSDSGCISIDTVTLTVISPDSVDAGPNDTLCFNLGLDTLNQNSPRGGFWRSNIPGFAFVDSVAGIFDTRDLQVATNRFYYVFAQGTSCETIDSLEIFIEDTAAVSINNLPGVFCEGADTISLTATPAGGNWTGTGIVNPGTNNGLYDPALVGIGARDTVLYLFINTGTLNQCVSRGRDTTAVDSLPTAIFEVLPDTAVCRDDILTFNNLSIYGQTYLWDFGDGNSSTQFSPNHSYSALGIYTAQLRVASANGCLDSTTQIIDVSEPPVPQFETLINGVPGDSGCARLEVCFNDLSVPNGGTYVWDFGNGQFDSTANPPCVIYEGGVSNTTYYISLTITNRCSTITYTDSVLVFPLPGAVFAPDSTNTGCSVFGADFINVSTGNPTAYTWYLDSVFVDSIFHIGATPPRQFYRYDDSVGFRVFDVFLVAENACGTDTGLQQITVFPNTIDARFNTNPTDDCAPMTVSLRDLSLAPFNSWAIFDANDSLLARPTGNNPSFTFNDPGTYTIYHYANDLCSYDTNFTTVFVRRPPTVAFDVSDTIVCRGGSLQFTDQSDSLVNGFFWEFGDGDTSSLPNPIHTYDSVGTFTVSLTAFSDTNSCSRTFTRNVTVLPLPDPGFSLSDTVLCPFQTFSATADSAGFYLWEVGNGNQITTYTTRNIIHFFDSAGTYNVKLTFSNGTCEDSLVRRVEVFPQPTSAFELLADTLCGRFSTISLNDSSTTNTTGPLAYAWYVRNGPDTLRNSMLNNPSFNLDTTGTYQVGLVSSNLFGCTDTLELPVTILPQPMADLGVSDTAGCVPFAVSFTDLSTGNSNQNWLINGNAFTGPLVNFTYNMEGIDTVILMVDTAGFCFDTTSAIIQTSENPKVFFTVSDSQFCGTANSTVSFTNLSGSLLPMTFAWNFGDGSPISTEVNPVHTYTAIGRYEVKLVVTNSFGCQDSFASFVNVYPIPQAGIDAVPLNGCVPLEVSFTQQATNGSNYTWFVLGDSARGASITSIFTIPDQSFDVVLRVDTAGFCFDFDTVTIQTASPPTAAFDAEWEEFCGTPALNQLTNNSLSTRSITSTWSISDRQSSVLPNPVFRFDSTGFYDITLLIENDFGCRDSLTREVAVYPQPVAEIGTDNDRGCVPDFAVQFTNLSTGYSNSLWDFGDGNSPVGQTNPLHLYQLPDRRFTVSLIVDTAGFCLDTAQVEILTASYPVAEFNFNPNDQCGSATVNFDAEAFSAALPLSYSWDFDGGNPGTSALLNPIVEFARADTYQVELLVANSYGCEDSISKDVRVYPQPTAIFELGKDAYCIGERVPLQDFSSDATRQTWEIYRDGNLVATFSGLDTAYYPDAEGSYGIRLISEYEDRCVDELFQNPAFDVFPNAVAGFSFRDTFPLVECNGSIVFDNLSINATSYKWLFGDGDSSVNINPFHTYLMNGPFDVSLIANNPQNCPDTAVSPVIVCGFGKIHFPNALSPNSGRLPDKEIICGDWVIDEDNIVQSLERHTNSDAYTIWYPVGRGIESIHLTIYNQWGNVVWEIDSEEDSEVICEGVLAKWWDGTSDNGGLIQSGVYVWRLHEVKFENGRSETREGTVTLIR
ncbi:MAG: PKD domain-containing protein [Bacteroidia bacterium]|nr:PKD domain-containing protein [Bacteroidia bacterium]